LLFACAVAAEYVGTIFERLNAHIIMARTEAERGQEMWAGLIERLPLPALLIDPDTLRVVLERACGQSTCARENCPRGPAALRGVEVFLPDIVQELIVARMGERRRPSFVSGINCVSRRSGAPCSAQGPASCVADHRRCDRGLLPQAALDASEYAAFVIDARGLVLAFNKPAGGPFRGCGMWRRCRAAVGTAGRTPAVVGAGADRQAKMHIEIGPRIYQVTSSAISLAGEESAFSP